MALGKPDERTGGLVLTIPWPLSGEIAEEARLRGQDVQRSIGTMGRLWLATSRAKRECLALRLPVLVGLWIERGGEVEVLERFLGV